MKRKPISKKTRFEVFKRDKFACQYCGESAPEVVLEIDHIIPVASGGDSDIMNLLTACKPCNAGKSYRELSDQSALSKQRKQLEHLQERKEQLELLAKWRKGLLNLNAETEKVIEDDINRHLKPSGCSVSEFYKKDFPKWLKKFTLKEILLGIDSASSYYLKPIGDGYTEDSIKIFLGKILKTTGLNKYYEEKPHMKNVFYIRAIGKNSFDFNDYKRLNESKDYLQKKFEEFIDYLNETGHGKPFEDEEKQKYIKAFSDNLKDITLCSENYYQWIRDINNVDIPGSFVDILFQEEINK